MTKKKPTFTVEQLRATLSINSDTGEVLRKTDNKRGWRIGDVAGNVNHAGYRQIQVLGARYAAHRLVWYYFKGEWPSNDIDHINGDRDDNRLENLRDVTGQANRQNLRNPVSGNKSGFLGVSKNGKKWRAHIKTAGKTTYLGTFDSAELAHAEYVAAKRIHHTTCSI